MAEQVNIICIKWGNKYGPDYVNRLRAMVKRHLTLDHRFICFTDDPTGVDSTQDIEIKEIPKIGFADFDNFEPWSKGHGWLKVTSFSNPLSDVKGTTIFLDLDIVIVDNIDCFFKSEGEFLVIKEWDKKDATGNTSVYRFEAGAHSDLIDLLKNEKDKVLSEVRNEQEFVTHNLHKQGKLRYWPAGWCVSFKRHCLPKGPMSWFKTASIPDKAKIIIFHGKPHPDDAIIGRSGKWYRHIKPVPWIAENWK